MLRTVPPIYRVQYVNQIVREILAGLKTAYCLFVLPVVRCFLHVSSPPLVYRCEEGGEEGATGVVRVPHQPPMRTRPLTANNNPRARSLRQKQAMQEVGTPPRRLQSAPTPATRLKRDCDAAFSHGRQESSRGQRDPKMTPRGIGDDAEFSQSRRQEIACGQRETKATKIRGMGDPEFSQGRQEISCGRREVNSATKPRGKIEGAGHSNTNNSSRPYSSTGGGAMTGGSKEAAVRHSHHNAAYCVDCGGGSSHNNNGSYANNDGGSRSDSRHRWRSCVGAPSHGGQATLRPGGGGGIGVVGGSFDSDPSSRNLAIRVEVTALSMLHRTHATAPTAVGGTVGETVRGTVPGNVGGTVRGTVPGTDRGSAREGGGGVLRYGGRRNCVFTKRATVGGRRGSPPKQPSAVRRLKVTLDDMNDLNSVANW